MTENLGDDLPPTPPGWYPDPNMAGTQRYWNGDRWTANVAPLAPQAPVKPQGDTGALVGWGIAGALLLPIVGFIIGIVLLARDDKRGIGIMVASIASAIFWFYQLQPDPEPTYSYYGGY